MASNIIMSEPCDYCGVEILPEDQVDENGDWLCYGYSACRICDDAKSNMGHVLIHIKNFSNIVYDAEAFYYKDILKEYEEDNALGEEYYYRWVRQLKDKAWYREWRRCVDYESDEGIEF